MVDNDTRGVFLQNRILCSSDFDKEAVHIILLRFHRGCSLFNCDITVTDITVDSVTTQNDDNCYSTIVNLYIL